MNYPLITEYIEAIKAAEDNFDQLKNLRPVLDNNGQPIMSGGNFAVVFKMKDVDTGKIHAVKCFLKEQEGRAEAYRQIAEELENVSSSYLTSIKYLDKELFVDSSTSDENEFPVLLMDWVEGQTLDKYVREHIDDEYELSLLAYQFSCLATWLLQQSFAHGDLKPDNILVKDDGTLVLVDYDGMYVPAMKGQNARELGSPDFRHPGRSEDTFDEHIDDFPLVSILLSLKAISLKPELLEQYGASDRLLFSEKDYRNLSESQIIDALKSMMYDSELATLVSLFILSISQNNLSQVSYILLKLSRPQIPVTEVYRTEFTEEEATNGIEDEYGVIYSSDGSLLIKANQKFFDYLIVKERRTYHIKEGTAIICDNAFNVDLNREGVYNSYYPGTIVFPQSLIAIGNNAFNGFEIGKFELNKSLKYIGDYAFSDCPIKEFTIPSNVSHLGKNPFLRCKCPIRSESVNYIFKDKCLYTKDLNTVICCMITNNVEWIDEWTSHVHNESVKIADGVQIIGARAFGYCDIWQVVLPDTVTVIGEGAFANSELSDINIPEGLSVIEDATFWHCLNLREISIPGSIKKIGMQAFGNCDICQITIPDSVQYIGELAFERCSKLRTITIPQYVSYIGSAAFNGCDGCVINCLSPDFVVKDYALYTKDMHKLISCFKHKEEFIIPNGVQIIGKYAFEHEYLHKVEIPTSVITIEESSMTCHCLDKMIIPGNVKSIKNRAFWYSDVEEIDIQEGVEFIGDEVFYSCRELNTIKIPLSLKNIGVRVFVDCWNLRTIYIPKGTRSRFEGLLPGFEEKLVEQEDEENLNTEVTNGDLANAWVDEYGVKYSKDRRRLLKAPEFLKEYSILESTAVICNFAFLHCKLESISIPDSIKILGWGAFAACKEICAIVLPEKLSDIGNFAFDSCESLKSINIPEKISIIEQGVFSDCMNLLSVTIPDNIVEIGFGAFDGCIGLTSLIIPDSIAKIENHAFSRCKELKSILIPRNVKEIGVAVFSGCDNLTSIIVDEDNSIYDSRNNCNAIIETKTNCLIAGCSSTIIPNNISKIGRCAFFNCEGLSSIVIPESVREIEDAAFVGSSIVSIKFSGFVNWISASAFKRCCQLRRILVKKEYLRRYEMVLPLDIVCFLYTYD